MTLILFPLDAPGVTRRPIARMDGEMVFAEIFLDNVRVPVADRLGDEGQGWHVCMATAGFERGLMLRSPARYQVAASRLIALYEANKANLPASMGERVAQHWMDAEAYALSIYSTASRLAGRRQDRTGGFDQQDLLVRTRHRIAPVRARHPRAARRTAGAAATG